MRTVDDDSCVVHTFDELDAELPSLTETPVAICVPEGNARAEQLITSYRQMQNELMDRIRNYECAHIEQYSRRHHAEIELDHLIADEETVITRVQTDKGLLYTSKAVKN